MKGWGSFLIIIGIICAFSAITMDTSVATGLGGRVNNLGLMNLQTNLLIGAGIAFISGIMLIGFSSKSRSGASRRSQTNDNNKKCPYCAEIIKKEAVICRYCGKEQVTVEIINTPEESLATPEDCERVLLEIGYKMIKKENGWVIIEPLGERAAINTFVNTFHELAEYANSKRTLL
ncbi:zinc ribbon domain-containing protein [Methylobacter sp. G7]|uniref:zinc ribbon domain-containing protein n=1 Tax=Methylobacter sp. G7 TaxID=3230117 RepID=UPI003D80465E